MTDDRFKRICGSDGITRVTLRRDIHLSNDITGDIIARAMEPFGLHHLEWLRELLRLCPGRGAYQYRIFPPSAPRADGLIEWLNGPDYAEGNGFLGYEGIGLGLGHKGSAFTHRSGGTRFENYHAYAGDAFKAVLDVLRLRAPGLADLMADRHRADCEAKRAAKIAADASTLARVAAVVETQDDGIIDDQHGEHPPTRDPGKGKVWVRCFKQGWQTCSGEDGWRWEVIDEGIADITSRLQREGDPLTTACCEGHGRVHPHILLVDGRVLVVFESREDYEALSGISI